MNKLKIILSYSIINYYIEVFVFKWGEHVMGLGVAIAGGITSLTLLIGFASVISIFDNIETESIAYTEANNYLVHYVKSNMTIEDVSTSSGSTFVNFTLSGGSTKHWNFDDYDLFIRYDADIAGISTPVIEEFRYDENLSFLGSSTEPVECIINQNLNPAKWIIGGIEGDFLDPKILNANEVARICAKLSNQIFTNSEVIISVSSDRGDSTESSVNL